MASPTLREGPDKCCLYWSSFPKEKTENSRMTRRTCMRHIRYSHSWSGGRLTDLPQAFVGYFQPLSSEVPASGKAKRKQRSGCWLKAGKAAGLPLGPNFPVRNTGHKPTQAPQVLDRERRNGNKRSSTVKRQSSNVRVLQVTFRVFRTSQIQVQWLHSDACVLFAQGNTPISSPLYRRLRNSFTHSQPFCWTTMMHTYGYLHVAKCSQTYILTFSPVTVLIVSSKIHLYKSVILNYTQL